MRSSFSMIRFCRIRFCVLAASDAYYILINRNNKHDYINYIEHP